MIYIISSKYVAATGNITYSYMFDAEGCNLDKCVGVAYGYFWKQEDRYILNLFDNGLVFGAGGTITDLKSIFKNEEIPDCSVLTTNDNAEVFIEILKDVGTEFEWYKHKGEYLKTSQ